MSYNYGQRPGAPYFAESPMGENSRDYKIKKWDRPKKRGTSSKSKESRGKKSNNIGDKMMALKKNKNLKIGNVKLRSQLHAYVQRGKSSKAEKEMKKR